jgi:hypothetical protein
MDRRFVWFWIGAMLLTTSAARAADSPAEPNRIALAADDDQSESASSQPDTREQLAELSQRIDNLVKVSQQQQKIAQYQLVALAAICVLLVVLLASGLMRRRGI